MATQIVVTLDDAGAVTGMKRLGDQADTAGGKFDTLGNQVEAADKSLEGFSKETKEAARVTKALQDELARRNAADFQARIKKAADESDRLKGKLREGSQESGRFGGLVGDLTKRFLTLELAKKTLTFAAGELNEQWNKLSGDSGPKFANMTDRVWNSIKTLATGIDQAATEAFGEKLDKAVAKSQEKIKALEEAIKQLNLSVDAMGKGLDTQRWIEQEKAIIDVSDSVETLTERQNDLVAMLKRMRDDGTLTEDVLKRVEARIALMGQRIVEVRNESKQKIQEEADARDRLVALIEGSELPAQKKELKSLEEINAAMDEARTKREQLLDLVKRVHDEGNLDSDKAVQLQKELNKVTQDFNNLLQQQAGLQKAAAQAAEEKRKAIQAEAEQANENLRKKGERQEKAMMDLAKDIIEAANRTKENVQATKENTQALKGTSDVIRSGAAQGPQMGGPGVGLFGRVMGNLKNPQAAFRGGGEGFGDVGQRQQQFTNQFGAMAGEQLGFNDLQIQALQQALQVAQQQQAEIAQQRAVVEQLAQGWDAMMQAQRGAAGRFMQQNGGHRAARGRNGP